MLCLFDRGGQILALVLLVQFLADSPDLRKPGADFFVVSQSPDCNTSAKATDLGMATAHGTTNCTTTTTPGTPRFRSVPLTGDVTLNRFNQFR